MKIISDIKLDFSDVLIRPKRSTLYSRSMVDLERTLKFPHSKTTWTGVPIIAANMDTVGTYEVYKVLSKHKIITAMHKFYTAEDYMYMRELNPDYFMVSTGISDADFEKLQSILEVTRVKFICIDVANGYMEKLVEFCSKVRKLYPDKVIVAGNVVTREITEELILRGGVDIVKVGIGPGCFKGDTRVLMGNGIYKNISDIEVGDMVINKDGKPVKVLNKMNKGVRDLVKVRTNNWHGHTFVTPDHRYWIGDMSSSSESTIKSKGKAKLLDQMAKTTPKSSKYKWKEIGKVDGKNTLLMPKNFEWDLPEIFRIDLEEFCNRGDVGDTTITTKTKEKNTFNRYLKSGYDLGYIFGTFLGDGNSHISKHKGSEIGSCHWSFGIHETDIANKLQECIKNVLDYECKIQEKNDNVLMVNCYNKCFSKLLSKFSKRTNKHLPEEYYCQDKEYIQGIFDGLVDSDGTIERCIEKEIFTLSNTSKFLLELFYWCCFNLEISFSTIEKEKSIGNLKGTCIENLQDSYRVKTHTMNRFTKNYCYSEVFEREETKSELVWDIEVDCPSHSFIANNAIVHNSACTTRLKTGVGMPQLSAIMECADAAHGMNGFIIGDGGITCPGDMAKGFGGGADFIMMGGQFAGHYENPGELIIEDGVEYKLFYGMSSETAMKTHYGKMAKYRSSEGRTIKLRCKGPLENTVLDFLGGLRSTCTYINASKIKHIPKCCTFVKVHNQLNKIYASK